MNKDNSFKLRELKFDKQGLIPAIIQDYRTKEVLMLAYMNLRSLRRALKLKKNLFLVALAQKILDQGRDIRAFPIYKSGVL